MESVSDVSTSGVDSRLECSRFTPERELAFMDSEIDAKTFWKAIGCRSIGVAIVTA